jgi:hypothetical protein
LALTAGATAVSAQTPEDEGTVWRLDELHQGFCVQFLVEPAAMARQIPEGARALPAEGIAELHPALRNEIGAQPEFAAWAPSQLCLYYFGRVDADGRRVGNDNPRKAPLIGIWTVAAADAASGQRRDLALEVFTNSSRLESSGRLAGLDLREVRTTLGVVPEDEEGRPSGEDRYTLRIGKTLITWDGRAAADSAPMDAPASTTWRAEGRRGGWVNGSFTLTARMTGGMIGSLKVEGKDALATMLKKSPLRFVGPWYHGGGATLSFGR